MGNWLKENWLAGSGLFLFGAVIGYFLGRVGGALFGL